MTGGAQDSGAITRTMEREFWNGVPVVAYHWTIHDPECPIEGLRERPGIAYHWSTGPEDAARLISVADVEEYLSRITSAQEPKCFECGDSGEVYTHADDCDNDSCALNGDIDSCLGKVEPCGCATPTPAGWQPIESAPRDWTDVLVYSPDHDNYNCAGVFSAWCDGDQYRWFTHDFDGNLQLNPTHWMPLPTAPAEGGV